MMFRWRIPVTAALVDFFVLDEDGKPVGVVPRPMFFAGQLPSGRVFP